MDAARAPWVVLHDVVHPFVTPGLARRVLEIARTRGAAVAAVRSTSSAYHGVAGRGTTRVAPGELWLTRKPWAFRRDAFARGLAGPGDPHEGVGGFLTRAGRRSRWCPPSRGTSRSPPPKTGNSRRRSNAASGRCRLRRAEHD